MTQAEVRDLLGFIEAWEAETVTEEKRTTETEHQDATAAAAAALAQH